MEAILHEPVTVTISASDADGDTVTVMPHGLPRGATYSVNTGVLSWTPLDVTPVTNLT